jgi:hypothetical protein
MTHLLPREDSRSDCENDFALNRKELEQMKAGAEKYLEKLESCHAVIG